jgi:uncharacterized ferritin-like protein (DUF455 family)
MEIREFAESVLFGTSLQEKLATPGSLTDERPGAPVLAPATPGRPGSLQFKPHATGKAEFPGLHRLDQERERGKLLHFFANHELLATELMALVLLKFPDAPAAFRKGVVQTLKDEQEHTRLYIERMRACGIEFGELPVSGYFWRCLAPMEHPMDYVAGLCLTFEQANLDFARHYSRGFGTVGDMITARLLEKIYRDEIGHVAYGLKWFRRWKNPGENDWDAFCRVLKFPLSPQRAKGLTLNVDGRRAAGLDDQFIAELNVYSQSKGRTPNVYLFNPFAEGRIANGKSFNPTRHQAQLALDLENLPQFLCRQDDIILVHKRPSVEFLSGIKQAGFPLPEFVEHNRASVEAPAALQRKLGRLRPWAWSPDSVETLSPLIRHVAAEERSAAQRFSPAIANLYSKAWSAEFLRQLLRDFVAESPDESQSASRWLCPGDAIGVEVRTLDEALSAVTAIRARGHHKVVAKESIGLAGSNAMRFFEPELPESHRTWIQKSLAAGRSLVIEPWLERLVDFSLQLEMSDDGLRVCGYTVLLNDARGQYLGNVAESHHHTRIPVAVVKCFPEVPGMSSRLLRLFGALVESLEVRLRAAEFVGPVGIDAFVFRDATGAPRVKPVVEINPRYTMGRVTVELMRQVCQNSCGTLRVWNAASARADGCDNFPALAQKLVGENPLVLEGGPLHRIRRGTICLNDPQQAHVCLATFEVKLS